METTYAGILCPGPEFPFKSPYQTNVETSIGPSYGALFEFHASVEECNVKHSVCSPMFLADSVKKTAVS